MTSASGVAILLGAAVALAGVAVIAAWMDPGKRPDRDCSCWDPDPDWSGWCNACGGRVRQH